MSDNTLYLLRGVSGAGKSTLAMTLQSSLPNAKAYAADDFWYELGNGEYAFDIKRLGEAHAWCQSKVEMDMKFGTNNIIVHNTLTTEKELAPYLQMASLYNYKVVSLIVEHRHNGSNVVSTRSGINWYGE